MNIQDELLCEFDECLKENGYTSRTKDFKM